MYVLLTCGYDDLNQKKCTPTRYPGEKDRANTRLVRGLAGTMRISAVIREILTVQRPVMPKHVGTSSSKINDDGVQRTLKQACSGRYSGTLKLSSQRFQRIHDLSQLSYSHIVVGR
jgi:hypothetical protein